MFIKIKEGEKMIIYQGMISDLRN